MSASPDERDSVVPARPSVAPDGRERRSSPRIDVDWAVDCHDGDTFLYSYITNISDMGIFIATREPPAVGTPLTLRFAPPGDEELALSGEVAWVNPWRESGDNPNPGFGVRFVNLEPVHRERLVAIVHAIAYLSDER